MPLMQKLCIQAELEAAQATRAIRQAQLDDTDAHIAAVQANVQVGTVLLQAEVAICDGSSDSPDLVAATRTNGVATSTVPVAATVPALLDEAVAESETSAAETEDEGNKKPAANKLALKRKKGTLLRSWRTRRITASTNTKTKALSLPRKRRRTLHMLIRRNNSSIYVDQSITYITPWTTTSASLSLPTLAIAEALTQSPVHFQVLTSAGYWSVTNHNGRYGPTRKLSLGTEGKLRCRLLMIHGHIDF